MKKDSVYTAFLASQYQEAQELNESSDLVEIVPQKSKDCQLYGVRFLCKGLIKESGVIKEHNRFDLAIFFHEQYLRRCDPAKTVRWIGPESIWHPNIYPPFLCIGRITNGTPLVDIVHRAFETISFQKVTMNESNALNFRACQWARSHTNLFPVDTRPLRHRKIEFTMEELGKEVKE